MELERRIAWSVSFGGPAGAVLMWGASGLGFVPPHIAYWLAVVVGASGFVVATVLWCHIGWCWQRARQRPPRVTDEPNVRLSDAIWRAFLKNWDRPPHNPDRNSTIEPWTGYWQQAYDFAKDGPRQAAYEGKLPIWGRRAGDPVADRLATSVLQSIPSSYWEHHWIPLIETLTTESEDVTTEPDPLYQSDERWRDLRTNRGAIERLWPATGTLPAKEADVTATATLNTMRARAKAIKEIVSARLAGTERLLRDGNAATIVSEMHRERVDPGVLRSIDTKFLTVRQSQALKHFIRRVDDLDLKINDVVGSLDAHKADPVPAASDFCNQLKKLKESVDRLIERTRD